MDRRKTKKRLFHLEVKVRSNKVARLIKKDVYTDYLIELNEYGLNLILEGLALLDTQRQSNSEIPCMSYEWNLLQELKEIKAKQDEEI
ncbi:putative phage protein [Candidatus Hepatincola sp. Pdp]